MPPQFHHQQRPADDQNWQADKIEQGYENCQKGGHAEPEHEPGPLGDERLKVISR